MLKALFFGDISKIYLYYSIRIIDIFKKKQRNKHLSLIQIKILKPMKTKAKNFTYQKIF